MELGKKKSPNRSFRVCRSLSLWEWVNFYTGTSANDMADDRSQRLTANRSNRGLALRFTSFGDLETEAPKFEPFFAMRRLGEGGRDSALEAQASRLGPTNIVPPSFNEHLTQPISTRIVKSYCTVLKLPMMRRKQFGSSRGTMDL
jgi:hypothetical protein